MKLRELAFSSGLRTSRVRSTTDGLMQLFSRLGKGAETLLARGIRVSTARRDLLLLLSLALSLALCQVATYSQRATDAILQSDSGPAHAEVAQ